MKFRTTEFTAFLYWREMLNKYQIGWIRAFGKKRIVGNTVAYYEKGKMLPSVLDKLESNNIKAKL